MIYFYILMIMFAIILSIVIIWNVNQYKKNRKEYKQVTATCINLKYSRGGLLAKRYICTCKYIIKGKEYRASFPSDIPYKVGDSCEILIDPQKPSRYLFPRRRGQQGNDVSCDNTYTYFIYGNR